MLNKLGKIWRGARNWLVGVVPLEYAYLPREARKFRRTNLAYEIAKTCRNAQEFYDSIKEKSLFRSCEIYAERHNLSTEETVNRLYTSLSDGRIEKYMHDFSAYLTWDRKIRARRKSDVENYRRAIKLVPEPVSG